MHARSPVASVLLVLGLVVFAEQARCDSIDQQNTNIGWGFNNDTPSLDYQQGILAGVDGQLVGFEVYVQTAGEAEFSINLGAPWQTDTSDWIATVEFTSTGWQFVDLASQGITLSSGDAFALGVKGTSGGLSLKGSVVDAYTAGTLYVNGSPESDGKRDFAFKTHMAPVPEPGTWALMGLGVLGLAYQRRRRMKAKAS